MKGLRLRAIKLLEGTEENNILPMRVETLICLKGKSMGFFFAKREQKKVESVTRRAKK